MTPRKKILITGGAGFIGSHVIRRFVTNYPDYSILNLDKLSYAGNLENLKDVEEKANYIFYRGDITDYNYVDKLFSENELDGIIHLAAESHVDRSISDPASFLQTNIMGTFNLLEAARKYWKDPDSKIFLHISTDEVYGSLDETGLFTEETPYDPRSPYSASKASSDHLARAYHNTYDLPVIISNCSNNYGPNQFPEKIIPLMINNIKNKKELPVYGQGENVRDWLYVEDHASAIDLIFHNGIPGETYAIGGLNEKRNIDLVRSLCKIMDQKLGRPAGDSEKLITYVKDRPGHDKRYAINPRKIMKTLGWKPSVTFKEGLEKTVNWYLQNEQWLKNVTSGDYLKYYEEHYRNHQPIKH